MNRYILPLIAVIVAIPIFVLGLRSDPSALPSQYINKSAPSFDLPTLKDPSRRLTNAHLKGQVSLLNVWATWCAGCRAEHGFLMQLKQHGDIPIFAINWRDNRQDALRWLAETGDPYVTSGFDEDARVGIDWGVYGAPETFLLDAAGTVVYRYTGPLSQASWDEEFVPRIAGLRQ